MHYPAVITEAECAVFPGVSCVMRNNIIRLLAVAWLSIAGSGSAAKIAFFPFESSVTLHNQWDLAHDVPQWFSTTVDSGTGGAVRCSVVNYDTVREFIDRNNWSRQRFLSPQTMQRAGQYLDIDFIITGTISRFTIIKRSLNADIPFTTQQEYSKAFAGHGGVMVMGEANVYIAKIEIDVSIYDAHTGALREVVNLSTEKARQGLDLWLPFQSDNSVLNFSNMKRNPFGSVYFRKSIAGSIMGHFSGKMRMAVARTAMSGHEPAERHTMEGDKFFLQGEVLERQGDHLYIDLGSDDNLLQGEMLEVTRKQQPIGSHKADTLGWSHAVAGTVRVRFIRGGHFSEAVIVSEKDSIKSGDFIRTLKQQTQ